MLIINRIESNNYIIYDDVFEYHTYMTSYNYSTQLLVLLMGLRQLLRSRK